MRDNVHCGGKRLPNGNTSNDKMGGGVEENEGEKKIETDNGAEAE